MHNLVTAIDQNLVPYYKKDLELLLCRMGVVKGDIVILHASLKAFGYLVGGEETLIDTILVTIGPMGTLIMPTQTKHIGNPKFWEYPPVPQGWENQIRDSIASYDPKKTPVVKELGRVSGYFAFYPNTYRSSHPLYSFTACGKEAKYITDNHKLDYGLGWDSPLSKLYVMNAKIILLGTDFESNTSIHLSEYNLGREDIIESAPILIDGEKKWVEFKNIELDLYDDFIDIELSFLKLNLENTLVKNIRLDSSSLAKAFSMKKCVDFCTDYYKNKVIANK